MQASPGLYVKAAVIICNNKSLLVAVYVTFHFRLVYFTVQHGADKETSILTSKETSTLNQTQHSVACFLPHTRAFSFLMPRKEQKTLSKCNYEGV